MTAIAIEPEPERWEPPTMKSVQQLEDNPLVQCSCGRTTNADMMRVSADGFICDSCQAHLFRTGELTAEEFAIAQGAPPEIVERAREKDAVVQARIESIALERANLEVQVDASGQTG